MFSEKFSIGQWSDEHKLGLGNKIQVSPNSLHELALFSQESIIELLDNLPRKQLQAYTMAPEAENIGSIRAVSPDECSGEDLFRAANEGLFWFNLKRLETFDDRYQQMLDEMFEQFRQHCPQLNDAYDQSCDMLITSKESHTHFHMGRGPSMLWHLSGEKHLWCYPAMDHSLISQEHTEQIFAGERLEYTPYSPDFDKQATHYILQPGEVVSWPNSSPHRVENITPCVSLNVSYATPASVRRSNIQRANRFMMKPLGFQQRSVKEYGLGAEIKQFSYRLANRFLKFSPECDYRDDYATDLRINCAHSACLEVTDSKIVPKFLQ